MEDKKMRLYNLADNKGKTIFATTDIEEFNLKVRKIVEDNVLTKIAEKRVKRMGNSEILELAENMGFEYYTVEF